jgi:uncharacterized protein (DUF1800 family)
MNTPITMSGTAIAVNRFGLGYHLNETVANDPKQWLMGQFAQYQARPSTWANQRSTSAIMADLAQYQMQTRKKDNNDQDAAKRAFRREVRDDYLAAVNARSESALNTPAPFVERLVHFWSNHFAVSVQKPAVTDLVGAFELEAIRPFVLGNFKDMLLAVEKHPAMLLYLDQAKSIGPNSRAAARLAARDPSKKRGLNENLAREILELHTLGVRSGYTQADVTEFARTLTGWSVAGDSEKDKNVINGINSFAFRQQIHEPGSRNIMGKSYTQSDQIQSNQAQAEAVLSDLASSPATAKHIATKLARHFVSDTPPSSLIDKLTNTFLSGGGNLTQVYQALIDAPEAWQPVLVKFKTPWEWLISSLRGVGRSNLEGINVAQMLNELGQPVWKPGSPAGYDDVADTWAAPNALLRRVEMAQRLAVLGDKLDARTLANKLLVGAASPATITQISRSESASTGLALLLVSPEFLRR